MNDKGRGAEVTAELEGVGEVADEEAVEAANESKPSGNEVVMKMKKNRSITWKVIYSIDPDPADAIPEVHGNFEYGIKAFSCSHHKKSEFISGIFLWLLFKDWMTKVYKLEEAVLASKCKCRLFMLKEFLVGIGIIIGAAEFAKRGSNLFVVKDQAYEEENDEVWASLCHEPHFEQYMAFSRWKDFRRFFLEVYADAEKKSSIPWYQFSSAVDKFNDVHKRELCDSLWLSIYEIMCAWKPRKTALEGLPNISFIVWKPEPLVNNLFI